MASQNTDSKWVTVLAEPAKTAFIQYETDGINRLLNPGTAVTGASSAQSACKGGKAKQ